MKNYGILPPLGLHFNILKSLLSLFAKNQVSDLYRGLLDLPLECPPELTLHVANTLGEIEEAFALVHSEYWEHGYIDKKPKEMFLTKFNLLPTSSVVVAKWKNEVVGTCCLVNDGPFGLPSEGLFRFDELRTDRDKKIAEATLFAVKENFENVVTWPLLKFFYELSRRVHNIDTLVFALPDDKNLIEIFKSLFFCKALQKHAYTPHPCLNYGAIRLFQLDFATTQMMLIKKYWKKPIQKDLFNFLHNLEYTNFEFPHESIHQWSASQLKELLTNSDELIDSLSEYEKLCLKQFYQEPIYDNILPTYNLEVIKTEERKKILDLKTPSSNLVPLHKIAFFNREIRFKAEADGFISSQVAQQTPIKIIDISLNGMRVQCSQSLKVGQPYTLKTDIGNNSIEIAIRTIWAKKESNIYGFRIEDQSKSWRQVIHYLIEKEQAS
ncbi:MAG: PilZ domain-containing protein [Bdellovibrionales bacterium]|nr:PilZ domain-containing protein [Bdellovibrionales bacterium]